MTVLVWSSAGDWSSRQQILRVRRNAGLRRLPASRSGRTPISSGALREVDGAAGIVLGGASRGGSEDGGTPWKAVSCAGGAHPPSSSPSESDSSKRDCDGEAGREVVLSGVTVVGVVVRRDSEVIAREQDGEPIRVENGLGREGPYQHPLVRKCRQNIRER